MRCWLSPGHPPIDPVVAAGTQSDSASQAIKQSEDLPRDRPPLSSNTPSSVKRMSRPATAAVTIVVAAVLVLIAITAQRGASTERIRDPLFTGDPRPLEPLYGFDHWVLVHQVGTLLAMIGLVVAVIVLWRRHPRHPYALDGVCHDDVDLARPGHELGALRRLQPRPVPLPRRLALGFDRPHGAAVRRDRLRDLLPGTVLHRYADPASPAGQAEPRSVRIEAPAASRSR